jgi:hypothetical protein
VMNDRDGHKDQNGEGKHPPLPTARRIIGRTIKLDPIGGTTGTDFLIGSTAAPIS